MTAGSPHDEYQHIDQPDDWVVVKITDRSNQSFHHRVFCTWRGGYVQGEVWQMNSGIIKIEEDGDLYLIHGFSGSIYAVRKNSRRLSGYGSSVLNRLRRRATGVDIQIQDDQELWSTRVGDITGI